MGSDHFYVNELYTRELEALPLTYTLLEQNYKSFIMAKNNNISEIYFRSVCIDEYILIPSRYLIIISKIQHIKH